MVTALLTTATVASASPNVLSMTQLVTTQTDATVKPTLIAHHNSAGVTCVRPSLTSSMVSTARPMATAVVLESVITLFTNVLLSARLVAVTAFKMPNATLTFVSISIARQSHTYPPGLWLLEPSSFLSSQYSVLDTTNSTTSTTSSHLSSLITDTLLTV